jgi:type IV pilus assembly protein PilA
MKKNRTQGVTLIELVVVVVIIGILAGIMMPQYQRSRERAVDKQAQAILTMIRAAERAYKMEVTGYCPSSGTISGVSNINSNLNLDLVNDGNWQDYQILPASAPHMFNATVTRTTTKNAGYPRRWWISTLQVNASCVPDGVPSCP